jgi:uncharacterized protein
MRPLRALIIYILVVFVGGALLAPWLYWLAQAFAHVFPKIAGQPFNRFVDRSLLLLALAGLWPLLRSLGVTSWREIGMVPLHGQWNKLLGGLLLGFVSLAVIAAMAFAGGARVLTQTATAHQAVAILFKAIGTAAVVAVMEEILFRGGLFGGLRKLLYWPLALLGQQRDLRACPFSAARGTCRRRSTGVPASSCCRACWAASRISMRFVPGFFNLTLAGMLLGLAYQRTGNLYFSIGLHAGWIFWLKTYGAFTAASPNAPPSGFGARQND